MLVVNLVLLSMGFAIMLSAASLFFRDVKYLVEVILTFAIFVTPVFYETSVFGDWATLLQLNPVAPILEGFHASVVGQTAPSVGWVFYSLAFSVLLLITSFTLFARFEPLFAEKI